MLIFPSLIGLTWPVKRSPVWSTIKQQAISGRRTAQAEQSFPLWKWELAFDWLSSTAAKQDFQTLAGFYNQLNGGGQVFAFTDQVDFVAANASFGVGDGATAAFQLARPFGGFVEPVYLPNPTIVMVGAAPSLTTVATGALPARTYFVRITRVTASGEMAPSLEGTIAIPANSVLKINSPATFTGATGWNAYVGTTSGTTETKQNGGTPIAIGTAFQEPTSGLVAGSALPAPPWVLGATGIVTFNQAPPSGLPLAWTGSFGWMCLMDDDQLDFEAFAFNFWALKKCSFTSVKL